LGGDQFVNGILGEAPSRWFFRHSGHPVMMRTIRPGFS
jgi:hypothetical protein